MLLKVILLVKTVIVYDSWFGNTQKVAEAIGKGINETEKTAVAVSYTHLTLPTTPYV